MLSLTDFEMILDCKFFLLNLMTFNSSFDLTDQEYYTFDYYLDAIKLLLEKEPAFILLDKGLFRAIKLFVYNYRMRFNNNDRINSIISFLNNGFAQPNIYGDQYINWLQELHGCDFYDKNTFASDYSVYSALKFKQVDLIEVDDNFLFSIRYLLYMAPDVFEADVSAMVMAKLKQIKCFPFSKRAKLINEIKGAINSLAAKKYIKTGLMF